LGHVQMGNDKCQQQFDRGFWKDENTLGLILRWDDNDKMDLKLN
jgi:hypothetical protein